MFGRRPSRPGIARLHYNLAEMAEMAKAEGHGDQAEAFKAMSADIAATPELEKLLKDIVDRVPPELMRRHNQGGSYKGRAAGRGTRPPVLPL